jgi:ABC-2 type transport system ATP-binding protein
MDVVVRCRNLFKTYDGGIEAVRGLDLDIHRGECFGLLGPNGAGKTTTIEILEGLLQPASGEVEILGRNWGAHQRELRELLGISLQETRLSEKLTVRETLRLFSSFYKNQSSPEVVMEEMALTEKADTWVGKLSGGQRQRLAVAAALVGNPSILFLDEPTTGLDPQSRRQVWEIIRRFQQRGGTALLTTHYMDEAERVCDRLAIIDHGRVLGEGTPATMKTDFRGALRLEAVLDPTASSPLVPEFLHGGVVVGRRLIGDVMASDLMNAVSWARTLQERGVVEEFSMGPATLEDVYVRRVGAEAAPEDERAGIGR